MSTKFAPSISDNEYQQLPLDPAEDATVNEKPLPEESNGKPNNEEESSSSSDSQSDSDDIIVPPDGGWGWVVVFGSFMCNLIVDGIIFSFGLFLDDMAKDLGETTASTALVGSLLTGFYLMVGPFTSAIANRYGFQLVAVIGCFLGAIGFAVSYFVHSVSLLCVTYGIIGGIGLGFIYVPAVVTVGFYFEKWRALATGIGVCGSGIGTFIFAPLCAELLRSLQWRASLLVLAGIILTCGIFGLTFRPLKPTKIKDLKEKDDFEKPELKMDSSKLPPAARIKMEEALASMRKRSDSIVANLNEQSTISKMLGVNNNAEYPTAAELWGPNINTVYHTIATPQNTKKPKILGDDKRLSIPFATEVLLNGSDNPNGTVPLLKEEGVSEPTEKTRRYTISEKRSRTVSENVAGIRSRKRAMTGVDINRPLYRDDIFFTASLTRIPQYTSQSSIAYNLSVTRPPTKNDIDEEKKRRCRICPESVRRPLANMLDFSLLRSPSFLILAGSGFLTMVGLFIPFIYMTQRATSAGIDAETAVWLISAVGIANTVGRVISGLFSSLPSVNVLLVYNVAISISGISTMMSGLSLSFEYQILYAVVYGLSISCFASLRTILVVELLGLEKLTNAFGLLLLFQGIAACIGTPLAGKFLMVTGSYDASFYLAGSFLFVSAIMCYPLNVINRWEKSKLKNDSSVVV